MTSSIRRKKKEREIVPSGTFKEDAEVPIQ
jgi:hypothetical protein